MLFQELFTFVKSFKCVILTATATGSLTKGNKDLERGLHVKLLYSFSAENLTCIQSGSEPKPHHFLGGI